MLTATVLWLAAAPQASVAGDEDVRLLASSGISGKPLVSSSQDSIRTSVPASLNLFESEPIAETVLFINGQLIAPPLVVTAESDRVLVNNVELPIDEAVHSALRESGLFEESVESSFVGTPPTGEPSGRRRFRGRRRPTDGDSAFRRGEAGGRFSGPDRPPRNNADARSTDSASIARAIANWITCGRAVVVAFPEQPLVTFQMTSGGLELLTALQTRGRDQRLLETVLKQLPHGADHDTYLDWIKGFQSNPAMDDLVTENFRLITDAEARNSRALAAADRLRIMSFPMSIAGLLLSVFAFGHIVANKPPDRFTPVVKELTPEAHELVSRCLILVVALSSLDLIWTILASQANQMTEINPLGRAFIADPLTLAGFKLLMTGLGVALLYALKKHRIAQTASWWACLILTLLTMRWLTFNSMFA